MKKLIRGILQFREAKRAALAPTFAKLALGQKPDALFIACSDSRMAVNVFASSDPGDLFVLRNIGNLIPPYGHPGGTSSATAVDYAVDTLSVHDIIVCGHSNCGAIAALCQGRDSLPESPLKTWLAIAAHNEPSGCDPAEASRRNVLLQIEHLKGYPSVQRAIAARGLRLHGMWFDIGGLDVLYYEESARKWTVLDGADGERILASLVN